MALAHRTNYRQNEQPSPRHEDWNALRDELETLLEQVELQQKGRSSPPQSVPHAPFNAAALSTQNQVYSQERRQQALSSVQQAIERFNEPDEASLMPPPSPKQLQTAIDQIRASQNQFARGDQAYDKPGAGTHKPVNISRFTNTNSVVNNNRSDELSAALADIGRRLERFESAIGSQQNSAQALQDMAIQVEQLSSVVELLANSVGERSQMKRLEAQISKLADVVGNGSDLDFNSIDQRLEVLSGAFERLSQLQSEQWQKQELSDDARHLEGMHLEDIQTGVRNIYERLDNTDMGAIENSVRSIYDRIDALEANMAMPLPAIERLSRELADFSKALHNEKGPVVSSSLVTRVDALNQRISQIEDSGQPVEALKIDMQELHDAVVGAMEPRFAALEDKIGALSGQFATKHVSQLPDISVEGLEKQIRLLAEKMDQTSSELGGLQRLYSDQGTSSEPAPDGTAIAELVAKRTAEAVQKAQEGQSETISLDAMAQLETRLSSLFDKNNLAGDQQIFSRVQDSIEQVNQRLERLEISLRDNGSVAASSREPAGQDTAHGSNPPEAVLQQKHHSHPGLADGDDLTKGEKEISQPDSNAPDMARLPENEPYSEHSSPRNLIPEPDDRMPKAPSDEAPLNAPPYPAPIPGNDRVPVPQSLRTDPEIDGINEISDLEFDETARERIETSEKRATGTGRIKLPQFNRENIALPPAPASSLEATDDNNNAANLQNAGGGQGPEQFQDKLTRVSAAKTQPDQPVGARQDQPVGARQDNNLEPGLVETKTEKSSGQPAPATNGLQESGRDKVSRSTFIEAARRAAQKHNPEPQEKDNQSLIGRALARFQKKRAADKSSEGPQASEPEPSRPGLWRQKPAQTRPAQDALSKKEHLEEQAIDDHAPKASEAGETGSDEFDIGDLSVKEVGSPQSFLNKYRQPILLVAALLTVSLLTINLINQRSGTTASSASPVASDLGAGAPPAEKSGKADAVPAPLEPGGQADIKTGNITTGSVEGFPAQTGSSLRVIDPSRIAEMPPRLNLASLNSEQITTSPLTLKLPPKAIGPMALREAAARGDVRAQFEVGAIYAEGRAIPRDLAAAARWYERAASQGFAPAAYRIGNMYENGVGVDKNLEQARLWYKLGAQGGNRMAMHNLAALLASGGLGKQRFGEAAQWFEKAAALGLKDSQFNLGMLYARGLGVKKDLKTSFKWFSIAAAQGDEGAIKAAQNIASSLDPATLVSLRAELKNWVPMKMNIKANFAPIGTWSNNFDPGPAIQKRDVILQVQAVLNRIGFDTGKPDGLVGPKTVEAIDAFERAIGMSASGQVNPRLLAVLGSQPV